MNGYDMRNFGMNPPVGNFDRAHEKSDTDQSVHSIHHTLGPGPTQAAPGSLVKRVTELEALVFLLDDRIAQLEEGP